MNFLIVRMNSQAIQLSLLKEFLTFWKAVGESELQVGLIIAWFTALVLAVQVGLEGEHCNDL